MSNAIANYDVIHNNPFIFAPLFVEFFRNVPPVPNSILLSYLVLPLVLPKDSRTFLSNATSTSTLVTFLRKRSFLEGLNERISEYRKLTNQSLRHAADLNLLEIGNDLAIRALVSICDASYAPTNTPRASRRLGILFSGYDIPTIYRTFGVRKL
jgi:hypothetical protein